MIKRKKKKIPKVDFNRRRNKGTPDFFSEVSVKRDTTQCRKVHFLCRSAEKMHCESRILYPGKILVKGKTETIS